MSADDFQTKYASVMESMLKSAVAETTKLFETMVDELKAEISKIRQENEDLKTKCSQFEKASNQPAVYSRDRESVPGRSDGSERRDTAVQCDLVSFRTPVVEQCQPLQSSVQNQSQQCGNEEMEYVLHEHNYQTQGEGNSQMAYILVRQESVLKQEEVEPTLVCGHVLSDKSGSSWPNLCGTDLEGPFINSVSSTREISLPQQHEGTQMAMEPACFRTCSVLQGAQNQSSEQEHPLVISLAAMKDGMEYAFSQKISEPVVLKQCQRQGEKLANKPTDKYANFKPTNEQVSQPTLLNKAKACDGLDNDIAEGEASSPLLVRRRRGRPPKKAKHFHQPVKDKPQSSSDSPTEQELKKAPAIRVEEAGVFSAVHAGNMTSSESPQSCPHQPRESLSFVIPSVHERANTALEDVDIVKVGSLAVSVASLSKDFEERPIPILPSAEVSSAFESDESPQFPAAQSGERCTSVTLQDAMLLVEAMNQSSPNKTPALPQTVTAPHVCTSQTADIVAAELQTPLPPVETHKTVDNLPLKKDLPPTQLIKECMFTLSNTTTSSVPTSTAVTQTSVQSFQQHPSRPLITSIAPSKSGKPVPHKIIVMPKTVFTKKNAPRSPTQLPTAISSVVDAQNDALLSGSTTAGLPVLRTSLSSVPQKTVYAASSKSLPSQSTHTAVDPQSVNVTHPKITIIIPRQVSAVALQKHEPQSIVLTAKQLSSKLSAPVKVSSPHLISSSLRLGLSEDVQTPLDEAATIRSQKRHSTSDNMESPKPSASVSETNASVAPQTGKKLAVVVRLTRLPLQLSTKDTVVVSRQPNGSSITKKILKESTTQDKPSEAIASNPPQAPVLSPDIWPSLATSVAESENNSDISEESNEIQDEAPLSFENCTVLEESSDSRHVQPSTPSKVSTPVFEKSTITINTTEPSAKSGTAGEPASILDKMSKAQFLAQLAVLPVLQNPEKVPCNDCVDARACVETSNSDETRLQKNPPVAQLRSYLKTNFQAKKTATNPELCTDTETCTQRSNKPRLDNDSLNDKNTTNEPTPIIPSGTGPHKEGVKSKNTVREPTASSRWPKAVASTPMMPRRSSSCRNNIGSRNEKSTFGSATSSSVKECDSPNTSKDQMNSLCTESGSSPKNGGSPNSAKSTSTRPKRTGSSRDVASPKKTKFVTASPRTCGLSKNGTTPSGSTSVRPQRCTVTKDSSSSKNTKGETGTPSIRWPKVPKGGVNSRETGESTSAKSTLSQDGTGPKKNLREVNAKKLAKTENEAKIKNSHQSELQNGAKTSQFPENQSNCMALKTCTTTAVWTPPRMLLSKTTVAGGKRSANLPLQTEVVSPKPPKDLVVYPPSISLHPIPVKAPPVVSPLQPLSVIGRRLLKNQCGECGRVLSSGAALESHVRLHSGRRPFSCMLCGKRFPDSKGLKRHGRVHRNGRIHICPHCGKGFVYRFGLTKHVQMVHSRIKPFVCQICNSGFFTKRDVEAHIRIHTGEKPFHCNLCEKKFTRRVELNVHLRWHNGEKRHWCPYCGKGFLDFNNLKRHKYIHTGEKPHSCPHCPKHFTQSGHLKKHVKNVHKIQ